MPSRGNARKMFMVKVSIFGKIQKSVEKKKASRIECKNRSLIQINGIYLHYLHTIQNEGDDFLVFKFHASGGYTFNLSILCHMKLGPTYPAKVLLIGEYTVLQGGAAIGLPIVNYFSEWDKGTMAEAWPLLAFHRYLQTCCPEILDLERWYDDLQSGYFLRSSIPARAGLGSSGNLVAAVYDRFAYHVEKDQHRLQSILAQMENFFHGTSSGFDPLIILRAKPLVKKASGIEVLDNLILSDMHPWIMDSQSPRAAQPINVFNQKLEQAEFLGHLAHGTSIADQLIWHLIEQEHQQAWEELTALSLWQLQYLDFLIPESIRQKWREGLEGQRFLIKLCGAGGGGMFQVWTKDPEWPQVLSGWPHELLRYSF